MSTLLTCASRLRRTVRKVATRHFLPPFPPIVPGGHGAAGESAATCVGRWSRNLTAAAGNGHVEPSNGSASRRRVKWGQPVRVSRCWPEAERGSPCSGCRCSRKHFATCNMHYVITYFNFFSILSFFFRAMNPLELRCRAASVLFLHWGRVKECLCLLVWCVTLILVLYYLWYFSKKEFVTKTVSLLKGPQY